MEFYFEEKDENMTKEHLYTLTILKAIGEGFYFDVDDENSTFSRIYMEAYDHLTTKCTIDKVEKFVKCCPKLINKEKVILQCIWKDDYGIIYKISSHVHDGEKRLFKDKSGKFHFVESDDERYEKAYSIFGIFLDSRIHTAVLYY